MDNADDLSAPSILTRGSSHALPVVLEGVFPDRLVFIPGPQFGRTCNLVPSRLPPRNCNCASQTRKVCSASIQPARQPISPAIHPVQRFTLPEAMGKGRTSKYLCAGNIPKSCLHSCPRPILQSAGLTSRGWKGDMCERES